MDFVNANSMQTKYFFNQSTFGSSKRSKLLADDNDYKYGFKHNYIVCSWFWSSRTVRCKILIYFGMENIQKVLLVFLCWNSRFWFNRLKTYIKSKLFSIRINFILVVMHEANFFFWHFILAINLINWISLVFNSNQMNSSSNWRKE